MNFVQSIRLFDIDLYVLKYALSLLAESSDKDKAAYYDALFLSDDSASKERASYIQLSGTDTASFGTGFTHLKFWLKSK